MSLREWLERVANRTMDYDFTVWFWGDAIAFDGLIETARLVNCAEAQDFCLKYFRRWASSQRSWNDHLTPGYPLLHLYEITEDKTLLEAARQLARFLLEEVPRTRDGAPLYRPDQPMYRHTVWVDTIYHIPPFYALLAKVTGETRYYDEALREWHSHVRWLSSPNLPLLGHAVDTGNRLLKGYGWGRGNGWAIYGMVDTLELLPTSHPGYDEALADFRRLADAIVTLQDASGFWRTLLHDREAYLEASTAAFYGAAFAKAVRLGLLDSSYTASIEKAWSATCSRLLDDGSYTGVSACTWAGTTPVDNASMYKTLPTEVNVWGQGSALRFIAERIHSEKS